MPIGTLINKSGSQAFNYPQVAEGIDIPAKIQFRKIALRQGKCE
jgi:hypothetical protein